MVMLWTTRQRHTGVRTRKDSQWHTQVGFNNRTEIECEPEWGTHLYTLCSLLREPNSI